MLTFRLWLESNFDVRDLSRDRIYQRITTTGILVHRGARSMGGREYASDPGDFGRGIYYSTNFHRAKSYGDVTKSVLRLRNPIILTDSEAYQYADRFNTVRLSDEDYDAIRDQRLRMNKMLDNAMSMTKYMLGRGYDGLVCIHRRGELEIVDYSPYA